MVSQRAIRWGVLALLMLSVTPTPVTAQEPNPLAGFEEMCQAILERAVAVTEGDCEPTARNEACYGYAVVQVDYQAGVDPAAHPFAMSGDITALAALRTIATEPLDVAAGAWGMSVLRFQANLPGTRPGENVTFILFGDTQVENVSGDMSVIYLTNGLGEMACNAIPEDSLLMRAPQGMEVAFRVNGVDIRVGSTAILRAAPQGALTLAVVEGHGMMGAGGVTTFVPAGFHAHVPLSADGHKPAGTPGEAEPGLFDARFERPMEALAKLQPGAVPEGAAPVRVEGVVEAINKLSSAIVVYGHVIELPRWQLAGLSVGDWVVIEGWYDSGDPAASIVAEGVSVDVSSVIIVASPTPTPTPTPTPLPPPPPPPPAKSPRQPTPAATDLPPYRNLLLTSMCSDDPDVSRRWRVRNPNPYAVTFDWDVYPPDQTGQFGTLVAPSGSEMFFETQTIPENPNTVRIFVNGVQNDVKASGGERCDSPPHEE